MTFKFVHEMVFALVYMLKFNPNAILHFLTFIMKTWTKLKVLCVGKDLFLHGGGNAFLFSQVHSFCFYFLK